MPWGKVPQTPAALSELRGRLRDLRVAVVLRIEALDRRVAEIEASVRCDSPVSAEPPAEPPEPVRPACGTCGTCRGWQPCLECGAPTIAPMSVAGPCWVCGGLTAPCSACSAILRGDLPSSRGR